MIALSMDVTFDHLQWLSYGTSIISLCRLYFGRLYIDGGRRVTPIVHQTFPALCKLNGLVGSVCLCISKCVKQSMYDLNQQLLRKFASSSTLEEELHQQL